MLGLNIFRHDNVEGEESEVLEGYEGAFLFTSVGRPKYPTEEVTEEWQVCNAPCAMVLPGFSAGAVYNAILCFRLPDGFHASTW